jgi:hypothetical protein
MGYELFIIKLNAAGSALSYSTFYGEGTVGTGIAVGPAGQAFVAGVISGGSAGLPTHYSFATVSPIQQTYNSQITLGGSGQEIVLVLNSAGSAVPFATFIGASTAVGANAVGSILWKIFMYLVPSAEPIGWIMIFPS